MRIHPRLLMATPTAAGTAKGLRPAPLALLPPIPLYRRLLRAHRKHLPREMRLLGDESDSLRSGRCMHKSLKVIHGEERRWIQRS
ncbi:hypothetical protein DH86_00000058 [Scytalidium sp. 3C]|nr:hypothetical protein DH86_00000058 [Scytalidium sp. 3C]